VDCIEPTSVLQEIELEMALANDTPGHYIELAIEQRFRIALPPMATITQG
jgi:hypothetical protein